MKLRSFTTREMRLAWQLILSMREPQSLLRSSAGKLLCLTSIPLYHDI